MFKVNRLRFVLPLFGLLWAGNVTSLYSASTLPGLKSLSGHVPPLVAKFHLAPSGLLNATNELNLAIGLPLRNRAELDHYLAEISTPGSAIYHQYLTPDQFTAAFGPTEEQYQQVTDFAEASGLKVTARHGNRMVLDVRGPVGNINQAFHFSLRTYHHPTEQRDFYGPDIDPSVATNLPIADVSGLSNYQLPKPKTILKNLISTKAVPHTGSGSGGSYIGDDFRRAYVPGTKLTGAGQMVGLLQFDGYYPSDISKYATLANRTNIPLTTVLLDGYDGTPTTAGNIEVSLDIEMSMSMAPGLAGIVLFEAGPQGSAVDILSTMTASNQIKQLSCSWGWAGVPNTTMDSLFLQMEAQGQSFFNASGDSDAFTTGELSVNGVDNPSLTTSPSSSPYIMMVGGTTLSMSTGGRSYSSETVWNAGQGVGTSGGISSAYALPEWQAGLDFLQNPEASSSFRNIPDVALTADNVFIYYGNGTAYTAGSGTSCASPLWAAFIALVNQQASTLGKSPVGFINPALYEIANENIYSLNFHDTLTGDNTSPDSPFLFHAKKGYDLCTGLGTPLGANLINALVAPDEMIVAPNSGFNTTGIFNGPFNISSQLYSITNNSVQPINWSIINTSAWLQVSPTSGTLAVGESTSVTVGLNQVASNLLAGTYSAGIWFSNVTTGIGHIRHFSLITADYLDVQPPQLTFNGPAGGLYAIDQTFVVSNAGISTLNWSLVNTSAWLRVTPLNGSLDSNTTTNVTVSILPSADQLPGGTYNVRVLFQNEDSGFSQARTVTVAPSQNIILNGGFETGDFTDWTLVGDTIINNSVYNAVIDTNGLVAGAGIFCVHSGTYGTAMGETGSLAYLSQSFYSQPEQSYLISLWLENHDNGTGQEFSVEWITNSTTTTLYDLASPGSFGWTNMMFIVTAADTNSTVQFGAQNDSSVYGLDDVSVLPIPTPAVRTALVTNNLISFSWNSLAHVRYIIQYTTNLVGGNWATVKTNKATGYVSTNSFNLTGGNAGYYRILLSP